MMDDMRSREEVVQARSIVQVAVDFLRENQDDPLLPVMPTLEFEAGARYAIDWVLRQGEGEYFSEHLKWLNRLRGQLIRGQ
jgi:hypothetical protein